MNREEFKKECKNHSREITIFVADKCLAPQLSAIACFMTGSAFASQIEGVEFGHKLLDHIFSFIDDNMKKDDKEDEN